MLNTLLGKTRRVFFLCLPCSQQAYGITELLCFLSVVFDLRFEYENAKGVCLMVSAIFNGITQAVTAFIGTLNSGLTAILDLFYDSSASTPGLTVLGTLTVIVVGVSLVYWLFRLIMGMARLRG